MSRQSFAPSTVQVQGSEFVNDYIDHPDLRLVAAFSLGWVFFSGLRHVWFSAFLRELMWICKAVYDRLRGRSEEPVTSTGSPHQESAGIHRSSSCVEKVCRRKQRDAPVLLLCMAFALASLSSFLSLLTFYPIAGQTACTFVVAATAAASQAARVCSFLILGLDMRSYVRKPWELHIFWVLLGLGTVLSGVTAVMGTGQLSPTLLPNVAMCSKKRFLPTSLVSSILNFVLELYIIIRSLSLMRPPRLRLSIVQNARIVQAGSLLLFDLLVVIPNTTFTNFAAEFVPFSIGALGVLAAFNSSFGLVDFVPTRLDVHTSGVHRPSRAIRASEVSIHRGNMSGRDVRIDSNPVFAIAGLIQDIEADASYSPRATPGHSMTHLAGLHDEKISTPSPQPYGISVQTTMDIVSPAQLQPGNRLRREKILSYSSPVWAAFGPPRDESSSRASTDSQRSIEVTMSPTSNGHSNERDNKVLSTSSTILGSDIIRNATVKKGKDRMRIRHSIPNLPLSKASSVISSSRRVTHQSWVSRVSANPTTSEDAQPGSALPKGRAQSSRSTSSRSSKSKLRSKSILSSKSSNSIHSAKIKLADESPTVPPWIGSHMGPAKPSRPISSSSRNRVGFVRGPRPPPSAMRIRSLVTEGELDHPT